ncbi:MAG: glycine-rich protein [Gallionella sp.]
MNTRKVMQIISCSLLLLVAGCSGGDGRVGGGTPQRAAFSGDYAGFRAVAATNVIVPGDVITEANNWGGYYFKLASNVTSVRVSITGAAGSAGGNGNGGTGGVGSFDLLPAFLTSQSATGFWVTLGQSGRPSAGETGPITNFVAFNGGGAGTDWSAGENTYTYAAGGGGGSDVRLVFAGSLSDPHAAVDPCAAPASRIAVVGGGGGGTNNGAQGGLGGGFNSSGGNGTTGGGTIGTGATTSAGGSIGGVLCSGGNGLQDTTEGWAGGGGGGYYGGGAAAAHDGGGGGSGYLLSASGVTQVSTADGTQGSNAVTDRNGTFTITVH